MPERGIAKDESRAAKRPPWGVVRAGGLLVTLAVAICAPLRAENQDADLGNLMRESQQIYQDSASLTLAWWIPPDFWRVSFAQNKTLELPEEEIDQFIETVSPYIVVAAVKSRIRVTSMKFQNEDAVRANISVIDHAGLRRQPIPENELRPDISNLLGLMKPIISGVAGQVGENLHFFVFDGLDSEGNQIADARLPGELSVGLFDRTFRWKLPLSSLVDKKMCPADNEMVSGAWKYCPWHGSALQDRPK